MASTARAARTGDLVLVVGAGDVTALAPLVLDALGSGTAVTEDERPHVPPDRAVRARRLVGQRFRGVPCRTAAGPGGGHCVWQRLSRPSQASSGSIGWSTVLAVDEIRVSGVSGEEADAVMDLVAVPRGTPLARVDADAVAARVRERVSVAEASVRRTWPRALTVDVVPRTPCHRREEPSRSTGGRGCEWGGVRERGSPHRLACPSSRPPDRAGTSQEALLAALSVVQALPGS